MHLDVTLVQTVSYFGTYDRETIIDLLVANSENWTEQTLEAMSDDQLEEAFRSELAKGDELGRVVYSDISHENDVTGEHWSTKRS